jgi:hypothetical protein
MKPSIHEPLSLAQLGFSSTLGTTDRDTFRMSPRQTEPWIRFSSAPESSAELRPSRTRGPKDRGRVSCRDAAPILSRR